MRKIYITFSGAAYENTTHVIWRDAGQFGCDEVRVYDDRWLMEHPFYQLNRWIFEHRDTKYNLPHGRGFGWFVWKPLIILDALTHFAEDGDVVLYTDADTYPIADLSVLFRECDRIGGVMLFAAQGCNHANWCKRDTFIVMGQDESRPPNSQHGVARFCLFQKGRWIAQQFLMEWLTYSLNPLANTFDASRIKTEHQGLHEHRCEQAIMTNLAHRYGLKLYREACQAGASDIHPEDRDLYGQLFIQDGNCGDKGDLSGSRYRNV